MSEAKPGVTFRETMTGAFALGAKEPGEGLEMGRRQATELAMHATVTIRDLDRFISDPAHLGELSGTIDFRPLGTGMQSLSGVFNLFSPAGEPRLKHMVYELGFRHGDTDYYLAGKKEVRDDPGFDLWKDTTTLLTRLHRGKNQDGPVIGAGVLTLGVTDLVRLVSTFRVTHTDSARERAAVAANFGRLFLGELWDTYARHVKVDDKAAEKRR